MYFTHLRRREACPGGAPLYIRVPSSASVRTSYRVVQPRCELHGVDNHAVVVLPFKKDEVTLTHETAAELLHLIVTPERQPVYVHCLDGVTATGTLVMCLRKLQRWALPPIVAEYTRFDRRRGDQPWQPEPQHGQKCRPPPWQHPSSAAVCLLRARPAALGSSVLPGRGWSTGHPATASGARASRLPSRRSHRLWSYGALQDLLILHFLNSFNPEIQVDPLLSPLQPSLIQAATPTRRGCNPTSSRLQPYMCPGRAAALRPPSDVAGAVAATGGECGRRVCGDGHGAHRRPLARVRVVRP